MNIKTKVYSLDKSTFLKIIVKNHYKSWRIIYYGFIALLLLYLWFPLSDIGATIGIICFIILVPALNYWSFRRFVNNKENEGLYQPGFIELLDDKIMISAENGDSSTIHLSGIKKIIKRQDYALLYFSKSGFLYTPESAFQSNDEYELFLSHASTYNTK